MKKMIGLFFVMVLLVGCSSTSKDALANTKWALYGIAVMAYDDDGSYQITIEDEIIVRGEYESFIGQDAHDVITKEGEEYRYTEDKIEFLINEHGDVDVDDLIVIRLKLSQEYNNGLNVDSYVVGFMADENTISLYDDVLADVDGGAIFEILTKIE